MDAEVDRMAAGWDGSGRHIGLAGRRSERKVRAPKDAVMGNAHRP